MSGYDPSTDPHWPGEEPVVSVEAEAARLQNELTYLAQQMVTFNTPGWEAIEQSMFATIDRALTDLKVFRPGRTMETVAMVQGQITAYEQLLAMPERVRQEHAEKTIELNQLTDPALA